MTDPTPAIEPSSSATERAVTGPSELSVDLGAFLPEGSALAAAGASSDGPGSGADLGPGAVDLRGLRQLETDLAGVDAAILAIDGDDHARSPLLQVLLAAGQGQRDRGAS